MRQSPTQITIWFEQCVDEFLEFSNIPEVDRLHPEHQLCGLLKLHTLLKVGDLAFEPLRPEIVKLAYLDNCKKLTKCDILYLYRCGIIWDAETSAFGMIVN